MEYQDLAAFKLPPGTRGRSSLVVFAWMTVSATLFRHSPRQLWGFRNLLLRLFGARIGTGVRIRPTSDVYYPWKLSVGDHSWVGEHCVLYSLDQITIGAHVALAHGVYLCTGSHDISTPSFDQTSAAITLEDQCWIANDVFVSPGVTIGRGAVVGARSTVLKSLPPGTVCYGQPARPVRMRKTSVSAPEALRPSASWSSEASHAEE